MVGLLVALRPEGTSPGAGQPVSVKTFGAKGNGRTDDSRAIQAALDAVPDGGGTVVVPSGTYRIGTPVLVRRNGTKFRGVGTQSVLKLLDGVTETMLALPAATGTNTTDVLVTDVSISRLTLDGNGNGSSSRPPTFFGIQILHAERVELSELHIRDFPYEAITMSLGERANRDITVRNSRFTGLGRNAVHLGFGSNLRVSQIYVDDTPSQQWGPAAGNGIDVEVEGLDPFVDNFVVEDSILQRAGTTSAGAGISLAPAYGPIRNGTLARNVIRNHQTGVAVLTTSENVTIEGNWVVSDDNGTTGVGFYVQEAMARLAGNVVNSLRWPSVFADSGLTVVGPSGGPSVVDGNHFWGGLCAIKVRNSADVSIRGNTWGNAGGCFLEGATSTADAEPAPPNVSLAVGSLDRTPPAVDVGLGPGAKVKSVTELEVAATDSGEGVARVFFQVDGIPLGFDDAAPYRFTLDPGRLTPGRHTVTALAVDAAANLSDASSATVTVSR
ncbi:MAG: hypothetical protein QOI56_1665 [Actinomycetota bacterium]|nr:hypothetical protein [Actinomycetota bacterium]